MADVWVYAGMTGLNALLVALAARAAGRAAEGSRQAYCAGSWTRRDRADCLAAARECRDYAAAAAESNRAAARSAEEAEAAACSAEDEAANVAEWAAVKPDHVVRERPAAEVPRDESTVQVWEDPDADPDATGEFAGPDLGNPVA